MSTPTEVRLLGPVDFVRGGRPVTIASTHVRTLLAALAVHAGRVVSRDELLNTLWGDDAPRTARHALQVHVSRLRKVLSDASRIETHASGYAMLLDSSTLDIDRFELGARQGRGQLASGQAAAAVRSLSDALALWRGPAMADVAWERFADAEVRQLEERRLQAEEDRLDALLALGDCTTVAADAAAAVAREPLRERRWAAELRALYGSGRQPEALRRFQDLRAVLRDELGLEPSPALRDLDARIARRDPELGQHPVLSDEPVTRFARCGQAHLAWQCVGAGPVDVVLVPGFTGHLELRWEEPGLARLYRRLAESCRLILFDKRGTGMSDREGGMPPVEQQVDDVLAVMDAAGSGRAVLFGVLDDAAIALLAAAAHPERVDAVVTWTAFPVFQTAGGALGARPEAVRALADALGNGLTATDEAMAAWAPSALGDAGFVQRLTHMMRLGAGIGGAAVILQRFMELDIRDEVADIDVPVLILHRAGDRAIDSSNAEWLASHLRQGRAVLLPGEDCVLWAGDVDAVADEIERFFPTMAGPSN